MLQKPAIQVNHLFLQSICLKAELEALRGNLRRAGKLVAGGLPEEGGGLHGPKAVQALCNMGCIQHYEGKHHSALFCYSRALDAAGGHCNELRPAVSRTAAECLLVERVLMSTCGSICHLQQDF